MNKGFLTFSDDEPGLTMLKDEPEDLTHLAPVAGDECVPLETSFVDEFDLFLNVPDSYPLLSEELNCLSDSQSSSNSKSSTDPFFSYREDLGSAGSPSDVSRSHLGSPSHSKSPGDCSIPSLCSPGIPSDEDHMTQFMSLNMDASSPEGDDELSMRAPYIPMGDDLPLLISDDLMWGSPVTDKSLSDDGWSQVSGSNFVQLLNSDSGNSRSPLRSRLVIKCNDHGGGLVDPGSLLDDAYSRKNNMDWSESPCQTELQESCSRAPSKEGLTLKKNPPGVGPPDRCYKRAHEPGQNSEGTKRTKADNSSILENGLSRQLLQQLIKTQVPSASPQIHSASSGTVTWGLNKGTTKVQQRQQQRQQPQHQQQQKQQQKSKQQRQQQCAQQVQQQQQQHQPSPMPQYPHQPQPPQQQSPPQPPRPPQQPSDSVLMNLLVSGCDENLSKLPSSKKYISEDAPMIVEPTKDPDVGQRESIRKNSFSLLDPESTTIPSLADLSEQDYEVNAPVGSSQVLQGQDLLKALESSNAMME